MPGLLTGIVAGCLLLLLGWSALQLKISKSRPGAVVILLVLVAYAVVLHYAFGFPVSSSEESKGPESSPSLLPLVLALYLFMLAGMAAEYLYHFLDANSANSRFDWRTFLKPFLVSPLVFVPLAASLQNAKVNLSQFDIPLLMIFLVAFENGFLWRGYFNRKLAESAAAGPSKPDDQSVKAV
jgi:hypothetical protein